MSGRARIDGAASTSSKTARRRPSDEQRYVLGADLPIVLSVPKAAHLLGISKDLAYELVAAGTLPAMHLGRRILVPTKRLMEFIEVCGDAERPVPGGSGSV
jgi:excisionase family DNA binding protein